MPKVPESNGFRWLATTASSTDKPSPVLDRPRFITLHTFESQLQVKRVVFELNLETDLVGYHESIAIPSICRNWLPSFFFTSHMYARLMRNGQNEYRSRREPIND